MLNFLGDIGHLIMTPLYYAVSAIMVAWHWLFTELGLDPDAGGTWALSIIGLTLVVRAMLIPLFVKQIKSSRNMQLIQPRVKELQKKYGHDRERLAAETMALYKETGTNPFASCLPILVQMPIFLALFRMLDQAAKKGKAHGFLNEDLAESFGNSKLFGTIPIKDTFLNNGGNVGVMVMAAILVVAMTATTFLTQRQLMSKNMPADALTGPYAQQQKLLLYVLPVVFAVGGIAFPIGVLLYWTTSNLWTMGQQFYVIRNNPAPGTPAFAAKQKRDAGQGEQARVGARGHRHGGRAGARAAARRPPPAAQEADPPATQEGRAPAGHPQEPGRHRMSDQTQTETPDGHAAARRDRGRAARRRRDVGRRGSGQHGRCRGRRGGVDGAEEARLQALEREGDVAADYLEELLDIADLDGDLDMDVDGDRAAVSIVGADLSQLVGQRGEVLDALQELTRLAVYRETGERSRLMLDVSGYRADQRARLVALAQESVARVQDSGERVALDPMSPFERKVVHDAVAAAGLTSESEGVEPRRFVVILPR